LTREREQALALAIPGSRLVVCNDTGHLVLWEQPPPGSRRPEQIYSDDPGTSDSAADCAAVRPISLHETRNADRTRRKPLPLAYRSVIAGELPQITIRSSAACSTNAAAGRHGVRTARGSPGFCGRTSTARPRRGSHPARQRRGALGPRTDPLQQTAPWSGGPGRRWRSCPRRRLIKCWTGRDSNSCGPILTVITESPVISSGLPAQIPGSGQGCTRCPGWPPRRTVEVSGRSPRHRPKEVPQR
jgi:hypothetical protein